MATGFPEYQFLLGNKKPILYIGGYQLLFNRTKENSAGEKTAYFYCVHKISHGISCPSSAKAMVVFDEELEENKYILAKYNGEHSDACVPNSAIAQVKAVRESIKKTVLKNPTQKPSHVYAKEVDRVRDTLGEGFRENLTRLCPTSPLLIQAYMLVNVL